MKPQYIRFVNPYNQNFQCNISLQGAFQIQTTRPAQHGQYTVSSPPFLHGITGTRTATPVRIIINASPSIVGLSSESTSQKPSDSILAEPALQAHTNSSTSSVDVTIAESNSAAPISQTTTPVFNRKRNCSSRDEAGKLRQKQVNSSETRAFIEIWADHYPRLTSGGSRHHPIYLLMANQLNEVLKDRSVTAADMKSKIGNMVTEYRKKKKELGSTGSSPSSWPYYDAIDKMIGESPYNNDRLLSDSIMLDDEQLLDDTMNVSLPDLNSTQVSEQVEDNSSITNNTDEPNSSSKKSINSTSPSNVACLTKCDISPIVNSTMKKNVSSKKKRSSAMKIDLIKELVGKIESAGGIAARSEVKVIEILEKQMRLQQESIDNEREFLNVFKTMMNGISTNL